MDLGQVRIELEEEQSWRKNEIRFLRNQLAEISSYNDKKRYRKSLVVMLYSHYEGFSKFAMEQYVLVVNRENVKCKDANPSIVAGAWHSKFSAVESGDKKERVFKNALPTDEKLHRFARRREFVETIPNFRVEFAKIPDDTVDVESNLKPVVLRKNLYKLGLPHDAFQTYEGKIGKLLAIRNSVAHGAKKEGLRREEYQPIEQAIFKVMDEFMEIIINSLKDKKFLKLTSPSP